MKRTKIIAVVLVCVLIAQLLLVGGSAAYVPNETFTVTISVTSAQLPNGMARQATFYVFFDTNIFEYVSNEPLSGFWANESTSTVNGVETIRSGLLDVTTTTGAQSYASVEALANTAGVRFGNGNSSNVTVETTPDGVDYLNVTFKVKSPAENGSYTIGCYARDKLSGGSYSFVTVSPSTITVGDSGTGEIDVVEDYGGTITYDEATGRYAVETTEDYYVIDKIVVDGVEIEDVQGLDSYTVEAVDAPERSIVAFFAYTVNFNTPANGALSVSRESDTLQSGDIVRGGEVLTIAAAPHTDFELDEFNIVGLAPTEEPNTYTVTAEQGDPTPSVSVSFKEKVIEEAPDDPSSPWPGGGTEQNPYRITSAAQLAALRDKVNEEGVNYKGTYFRLTSDLNLTAGGAKWTPIGNSTEKPFSGVFDGGGNRLTVDIDDTTTAGSEQALFGWVGDAEIRNLAVYGSVKGYIRVAGIVGRVASGGTLAVENCENHADIMAASETSAGIVAHAQGALSVTITDCVNYGNTSCAKAVTAGIIVASASNTTITGCVNYGKIGGAAGATGSSAVGIAGRGMSNYTVVISGCANIGEVSGGAGASGIGSASEIRDSYNTAPISGGYDVAGIGSANVIENCYNTGAVTGTNAGQSQGTVVGGIVARASGSSPRITNCYNSGAVTSVTPERVGAVLGEIYLSSVIIENSYYLDSSAAVGQPSNNSHEADPVTSAVLQALAPTLGTSFENQEGGYPILVWQLNDDSTSKTQTVDGGVVAATIKGADLTSFTDSSDGNVYASFDLRGGATVTAINATVKNRTLAALSEANATLRLNTDIGNLTFDSAAITEIAAAAGTGDITLSASKLTADKTTNTKAKELIAAGKPVYEFTLKAGDTPIFTGGTNKGSVSAVLPYTRQKTAAEVWVKVFHIAENGTKTEVENATYSNGDHEVSFTTNHFSLYSIEEVERPKTGGSGSETDPGVQGRPDDRLWDGETIDVRWYTPGQSTYYINDAADLAGLAAIVNGIYNEDIIYIVGDDGKTKIKATWSEDGDPDGPKGNNMSTARYSVGTDDFKDKTVVLNADINMGPANYMPIGGQYLMSKNDSTTKISSSFNGTFDGGGHSVTIYTDRHCSNGNYGDGSSVGLIGRLGVHDGEAGTSPGDPDLRAASPTVKNVAVYGSVRANRSVGGVVGKIGKTLNGAIVENCANFADVSNTDAKGCGGIVGAAWNGGVIRNCYNAGNISTTYVCPTGGIAGSNEITIENCYNVGKISATSVSFAMGIGTNNGNASYSTHVINSYYLADEGMAPGGGYYDGTAKNDAGLTGSYMKTDEFVAKLAGADGSNAYVKDTRSINSGYPILAWQGGTAVDPGIKPGTDDAKTTDRPETEAVTDVAVKDGEAVVTVKIPEKSAEATDTPERLVVNVDTKGETVSKITVEIPKEVIALESGSKSEIEIRSEVANVLLPEKAVAALAVTGEAVTVKASKNDDASYTFTVAAGEKSIEKLDGGIKAVIPAEDATPGTVAVIVHADGTEEVIKKSVGKDGKVSIPLDGSATIKIVDNSKDFADVSSNAWYSDGVKFTSSHELFQGTDNGGFAPEMSMTRGMLATVLHRLENAPTATGELFADVAGDAYYAEAIIWASVEGIVNGTGDGFMPDAEINREQLAVMLYRYADATGVTVTLVATLDGFPDADEVSDWAEEALKWAVAAGLIQGRDSGLAPKGTATRAEVAVILERFIENIL